MTSSLPMSQIPHGMVWCWEGRGRWFDICPYWSHGSTVPGLTTWIFFSFQKEHERERERKRGGTMSLKYHRFSIRTCYSSLAQFVSYRPCFLVCRRKMLVETSGGSQYIEKPVKCCWPCPQPRGTAVSPWNWAVRRGNHRESGKARTLCF